MQAAPQVLWWKLAELLRLIDAMRLRVVDAKSADSLRCALRENPSTFNHVGARGQRRYGLRQLVDAAPHARDDAVLAPGRWRSPNKHDTAGRCLARPFRIRVPPRLQQSLGESLSSKANSALPPSCPLAPLFSRPHWLALRRANGSTVVTISKPQPCSCARCQPFAHISVAVSARLLLPG